MTSWNNKKILCSTLIFVSAFFFYNIALADTPPPPDVDETVPSYLLSLARDIATILPVNGKYDPSFVLPTLNSSLNEAISSSGLNITAASLATKLFNAPSSAENVTTAKANIAAMLKAKIQDTKSPVEGMWQEAYSFLKAYPGGSTSTTNPGNGSGGSGGSGSGGNGGSGSTPITGDCNPSEQTDMISLLGSSKIRVDVGTTNERGELMFPGYKAVESENEGFPVIEAGPLLSVTINKQIPILKKVCSAVSSLSDDLKRIAAAAEAIKIDTGNIDVTTKAILKDTDALVKKELTDDKAVWAAKAKAINDEKTAFNEAMASGRPTGVWLNENGAAGKGVTAPFTPDINVYEQYARKNAGELFYGQLRTYLEGQKNLVYKDELLQQIERMVDSEYEGLDSKLKYLGSSINNFEDASNFTRSLYNYVVDKAASNAVAEYIAGNTVIGGKTCDKNNLVTTWINTGEKDSEGNVKYEHTLSCKTENMTIATPAPAIKSLVEKFGTTELTQAEMADEIGETINVTGIAKKVRTDNMPKKPGDKTSGGSTSENNTPPAPNTGGGGGNATGTAAYIPKVNNLASVISASANVSICERNPFFTLTAKIKEPETVSVHRQSPAVQNNIKNNVIEKNNKLIQTTTYVPSTTGAQIGDTLIVSIAGADIAVELTNLNTIDIVRRLITEATAGRSDIKKALINYSLTQDGNILSVTAENTDLRCGLTNNAQ